MAMSRNTPGPRRRAWRDPGRRPRSAPDRTQTRRLPRRACETDCRMRTRALQSVGPFYLGIFNHIGDHGRYQYCRGNQQDLHCQGFRYPEHRRPNRYRLPGMRPKRRSTIGAILMSMAGIQQTMVPLRLPKRADTNGAAMTPTRLAGTLIVLAGQSAPATVPRSRERNRFRAPGECPGRSHRACPQWRW